MMRACFFLRRNDLKVSSVRWTTSLGTSAQFCSGGGGGGGSDGLSIKNQHVINMSGYKVMYCKSAFIRDDFISRFAGDKLILDDYFLQPCLIHTRFDIISIWQRLVRDEKYSRGRGSREPRMR